jgi:hypothetical protein
MAVSLVEQSAGCGGPGDDRKVGRAGILPYLAIALVGDLTLRRTYHPGRV